MQPSFGRVAAGETTWYGEGLHSKGLIPWRAGRGRPLHSRRNARKGVGWSPTQGAGLRDVLDPPDDKGCLEQ